MQRSMYIPLGVVIGREKVDHPWQEFVWRAVDVFMGAPPVTEWRALRSTTEMQLYHAATLPLDLHPKETTSYQVNLTNGTPSVYVVLRDSTGPNQRWPVFVHMITASPFEAQAYGDSGFERVERVPMPEPLVNLVEQFVAEHHQEEEFRKRVRDKGPGKADEHQFGQEPIAVLRERQRQTGGRDPR